jgi:hypothetical protein
MITNQMAIERKYLLPNPEYLNIMIDENPYGAGPAEEIIPETIVCEKFATINFFIVFPFPDSGL